MTSFDRVRPRTATAPVAKRGKPAPRVSDGRQSLFSTGDPDGHVGSVRIECARCGVVSTVSPVKAVRLATPGFALPIGRSGRGFLKCPACRRRSFVKVSLWHR